MKKLIPLFVFLLFAQFAFAQERPVVYRFYVDPPVIYENEPFDIVVGGFFSGRVPPKPRVTLHGSQLIIDLPRSPGGPLIFLPWGERIRIEGLVSGNYSARVDALHTTQSSINFHVIEKPFKVSPRIGEIDDEFVIEDLRVPQCGNECPLMQVFFGDKPARNVRIEYPEFGKPVVIAEVPEGTGLVDVTVHLPNGEKPVLEDAFRYGKGLESDYERVLLPSTYGASGAHGSLWSSEIVIRNDGPVRVLTEPLIYLEQILPDLQGMMPIPPDARAPFPITTRDGGSFLHVARGAEKWLTYSSHVLDRSRTADDRGVELPVVRADDTASEIRLLDIPIRPLFRSHLRIYDFDEVREQAVELVFRKENGTEHVMGVQLPPTPVCVNPPCLPNQPSFVRIDLSAIPELANAGEVDLTIRATTHDRRIWAFVSVTNNETQRVTNYTPQHKTPEGAIR